MNLLLLVAMALCVSRTLASDPQPPSGPAIHRPYDDDNDNEQTRRLLRGSEESRNLQAGTLPIRYYGMVGFRTVYHGRAPHYALNCSTQNIASF